MGEMESLALENTEMTINLKYNFKFVQLFSKGQHLPANTATHTQKVLPVHSHGQP